MFEGYSFYLKNCSILCSFISLQAYTSFRKASHCCLSCSKPASSGQKTRLPANPRVDQTSKEVSIGHLLLTDENHLELSFGSHPGAGLSTSHYPAHVLFFVITITVISTGSAMGYLHLASLMYILTLRPKMKWGFFLQMCMAMFWQELCKVLW